MFYIFCFNSTSNYKQVISFLKRVQFGPIISTRKWNVNRCRILGLSFDLYVFLIFMHIQGNQLNMAVFFRHLVKIKASVLHFK